MLNTLLNGLAMLRLIHRPRLTCTVKGFTVSMKKKRCVWKPEGSTRANRPTHYFEVTIRSTGQNPEYPAWSEPMVRAYVEGDPSGLDVRNYSSIRPGRFLHIRLVEKYKSGDYVPDYHRVMLESLNSSPSCGGYGGVSLATRKSNPSLGHGLTVC